MFRTVFLIVVSCYIVVTGCKDHSNRNLLSEFAGCDSATVMYYHEPGKPRVFSMAKVFDKAIIAGIAENVNDKVITGKDSCITHGKIYAYSKGDAVSVVYFNREPNCLTMSFIKTGEKYFVRMSKSTKNILDDLEKTANEPSIAN